MTQRKNIIYSKKNSFGRSDFPEGFLFGTASSAYQYEGAINEAPRGESVWDTFVRKYPERNCYSNADQAIEFYNHYEEDIQRMKDINMDAFRFSISWPRILPLGKKSKGVNKEGIKFYNDLIDELLATGITPLATLFHWDTPQALEDEYNGFLSEKAVDDFKDFATLCFEEFGDHVKLWVTLNEPWVYSIGGYDTGRKAPGRASKYMNEAAVAGESGLEVYTVSHNLLLAHAEAVEVFRNNPKCKDGKIGIAHCPVWFEPYDSNNPDDKEACDRAMEFMFGWHMDPTVYGDYPEVMKKSIGNRLPSFTAAQSKKLRGSFDFVGVNYYSAFYVKSIAEVNHDTPNWRSDARIKWRQQNKAGQTLGVRGGSEWDFLYPQGLRKFLNYAKNKYESPKFMITENGHCDIDHEKKPKISNLMDLQRTECHKKHLQSIQQAIQEDGVKVEGYFAWSLLDNCEWNAGYGVRYGLFYVDYNNGLKRFPKMSAMWFKEFLKREEEIEDSEKEEYVLKSAMNKKRFLLATGSASCFIPKMSESSKALSQNALSPKSEKRTPATVFGRRRPPASSLRELHLCAFLFLILSSWSGRIPLANERTPALNRHWFNCIFHSVDGVRISFSLVEKTSALLVISPNSTNNTFWLTLYLRSEFHSALILQQSHFPISAKSYELQTCRIGKVFYLLFASVLSLFSHTSSCTYFF